MRILAGFLVALSLSTTAVAEPHISRGEQMKICAAKWKAEGKHNDGVRYQTYISACLKTMSTRR